MSQRKLKKIRALEAKKIESVNISEITVGLREHIKVFFKNNWLYLLIMVVLIVGVFGNGMNGDYVSDDYASIPQNTRLGDFWFMFDKGNSMSFSSYLVYQMFGSASSFPFHLVSVLGYVIFCILAYFLIDLILENKIITWVTMALFVVHPIHVEAVTWISGRNYVIVSNYVIVGLIGFIFFIKSRKYKYLWISFVTFILAFLTDKPRAFAMFLLMVTYLLYFGVSKIKINWTKFILSTLTILGVFTALAWPYILNRINIVNGGYNASESIFYDPFFQYPTGLSKYFQLLWMPVDLTLYHTMYVFPGWLNWLILLTYLIMLGYFYFRNRTYFLALAMILAGVLLSIMPIKVSWLVAERYMFLGSLGFCLFLALLINDLSRYFKFLLPVITALFVSYYSIRTIYRNDNWTTNHKLWVNTCQVSPNSHNAWNNIGDDYDKLGQYDNAVKGFTQSTVVKPNYADAYHNRANIFYKTGRLDLARDSYNTALYYSPGLYQTYLSLVQIDMTEKKYDLAVEQATKALQLQPDNPQSAYVLGVVKAQVGQLDDAKKIMEALVLRYPEFTLAKTALMQLNAAVGLTK